MFGLDRFVPEKYSLPALVQGAVFGYVLPVMIVGYLAWGAFIIAQALGYQGTGGGFPYLVFVLANWNLIKSWIWEKKDT